MAAGVADALPHEAVVVMPLADGGDGLLDALTAAVHGRVDDVPIHGPLGEAARGRVLIRAGEAVVESADACGLHLVAVSRRDPLRTDTGGVGELIRSAAAAAGTVRVGLGGSATVDGGAGMARVLGYRLLDVAGRPLPPGGGALERLARIEAPASGGTGGPGGPGGAPAARARPTRIVALVDVDNPLLGPNGAARVYGPQKGADAAAVEILERGLARLAERWRVDLGVEPANEPGAGAAGGLGGGMAAFLGAELMSGAEWVLRAVGFDEALARARRVVTGEGAFDAQSAMGKVVGTVLERARRAGVPALLVAGRIAAAPEGDVALIDGGGAILDERAIRARVAAALRAT